VKVFKNVPLSNFLNNEVHKKMIKIVLFFILLLFFLPVNSYSEKGKNFSLVTSDGKSIYKLNFLNYNWILDERWEKGNYYLPYISPMGNYLAFGKYFENGFCIIDSNSKKIVDIDIDITIVSFAWSPYEKFLAFLGVNISDNKKSGNIYLYNIKTKELKMIFPFANIFNYPSPPSWNNEGNKIFFVDKDNMIIEFDIKKNSIKKIVEGKGVYWISKSELLIRKKNKKYYLYNMLSKKEKYLFKLGWWQYPPISLSPDKKIFVCWDTKPRISSLSQQWYTSIKEFPSGKTLKVISNIGANLFSWYHIP